MFTEFDFSTSMEETRKYHPNQMGDFDIYDMTILREKYEKANGVTVCPYCNSRAELVLSGVVYGYRVSYCNNLLYICKPCQSWVGTHSNTVIPLGTLAKSSLRTKRIQTHSKFDLIWKEKHIPSRERAYKWLSKKMNIPFEDTHIALFDIRQCETAISIVKNYFPQFFNSEVSV